MSDILFRYLIMARKREASRLRHLFYAHEPLLSAGVEQLVESAIARVEVLSQHERVETEPEEKPASRHRSYTFYDRPQPSPPQPYNFVDGEEQRFPLRPTLKIGACPPCQGSGKVRCPTCDGSGKTTCSSCSGSGRIQTSSGSQRCSSCRGAGRKACSRCDGSGRVTCSRCAGEGQIASWKTTVYTWRTRLRQDELYPPSAKDARVNRAFREWMRTSPPPIAALSPAQVEAHLGYRTAESLEVAQRADARYRALEGEAKTQDDRYLFHRTTLHLEPAGYTVLRMGHNPRWYWLVGRGAAAVEVCPRQRPSLLRLLLWAGASGSIYGLVHAAQLLLALGPAALTAAGALAWSLLALAGAGIAGAAAGLIRGSRLEDPIRTAVVIRGGERPSPLLPCLAAVGSYTQGLSVADRNYNALLDALLGRPRTDRQSTSLSVQLADGRRLRLIELAQPDKLAPEQIDTLVQAVNGILFLRQSGLPEPQLQRAIEQRPGLQTPTATMTWEARTLPNHAGGEQGEALPLDVLRRSFIGGDSTPLEWAEIFEKMWAPLGTLLTLPAPPARAPLALSGPLSSPFSSLERRTHPMKWLLELLGFKRNKVARKIPILGVEGSGKSSLIVTLGQYVSLHRYGNVTVGSLPLFQSLLPHVQQGRTLPATMRHSEFAIELRRVPERGQGTTDVDLTLSSEDIPGQDFRMLVDELTRNPELRVGQGGASDVLRRFRDLLSSCDGFVFVVDLLRDCTLEEFRREPRRRIWESYSDQVKPIMTGILLAAKMNANLAQKPMFFVFSKPDLHQLPRDQVEEDFRRAMAIPLGALRSMQVNVQLYNVQCAGWNIDSQLENMGIGEFLSDMAHAVGAVPPQQR